MTRYQGKIVLISGASGGLGRAIAARLAREGASVILMGRNVERLQTVASEVEAEGGTAHLLVADVRDDEAMSQQIAGMRESIPKLYLVVHAAGYRLTRPFRSTGSAHLREQLSVNVEGAATLTRICLPWIERGGSVLFISSVAAQVGSAGMSAYAMSKGALDALTHSLAIELAPKGIRVNAVAPGIVTTELTEEVFRLLSAEQASQIERNHPLGLGAPSDVASAVAFLGSEDARWITGTVLTVDGGYSAGR